MTDQKTTPAEAVCDLTGGLYPALAERSNDLGDDYIKSVRQGQQLEQTLKATLHPSIWALVHEVLEKRNQQNDAWADLLAAELGRHLPGLAPTLTLVWDHVRDVHPKNIGHCCAGKPRQGCGSVYVQCF